MNFIIAFAQKKTRGNERHSFVFLHHGGDLKNPYFLAPRALLPYEQPDTHCIVSNIKQGKTIVLVNTNRAIETPTNGLRSIIFLKLSSILNLRTRFYL